MSNWNDDIDKPCKCTICKYDGNPGCNCPYEFRELQCRAMDEEYFNCVDENGKRYRNTVTGKVYKG
jgi:hypothetical protein